MVTAADPNRRKLLWWLLLVIVLATLDTLLNELGGGAKANVLYQYSTAVGTVIQDAVLLLIAFGIAGWKTDLFALRRPHSWLRSLGLALLVFVAAWGFIQLLEPFLHGSREQGLVPKHWQPSREGAYIANWIVIAGFVPFVEELIYRGLGYSLLERYGKWRAIIVVGLFFAAAHGLVQAFPELAALGCGLAWLRAKTRSVFPGMLVHGLFNSLALAVVFFHTSR